MEKNLIYGVIAIVIIAASGFFIYNFAKEAYSGFKIWDDLTADEQSEVLNTFNTLTENMEKCRSIDDNSCICKDVFPSFPYLFRKEVSVKFTEEKNAELKAELLYNEKNIDIEKTIDNMLIGSTGDEKTNMYTLSYDSRLTGKKELRVLSPHVQKKESKAVLYFITSSISESTNFLDEYPVCMEKRTDAIAKFDLFLSKLSTETDTTIDLPSDYKIFYGGKVIKLAYKEDDVKKVVNNKLELLMNQYSYNVKCSDFATPSYLSNGDKISIEKTNSGFCIKSI